MAALKKLKSNRSAWTFFLVCACIALTLIGGNHYVTTLRGDLTNQAISNVLTVTRQQQQAFDTFISGDRERLHSFAANFSRTKSDDIPEIKDKLNAFAEVDAFYTVLNLDDGAFYSNSSNIIYQMDDAELEVYRALDGADVRDPYVGLYSSDLMFGYYERFTFADGVPGIFQKSYDCSKVSEEFSLSFYNGRGMGYVVTRQGDILLRAVDKTGSYSYDNIFDMVAQSEANRSKIADFMEAVSNQETGTVILEGDIGEQLIYTYVPVQNVTEWYLISIVPLGAVTQEADEIIMNSQSMLLVFLVVIMIFLAFFLLIWRSQKDLQRKDKEIDYRERQFDIFSTYLSNNTDDIFMMLSAGGHEVEYVSPNVERVLGVTEEDVLRDVKAFGCATYLSDDFVDYGMLGRLAPGESIGPMLTERVNPQSCEHKWFRESVYCVELQDENKIVVYISDRTKERQTQDTLSQALDMAQVANKAKSTFLGSVSHDIRTPMNAIMGLTMLLQDEADDPDQVLEYSHRIEAASQHLLGLINDVLDINKIEGGNTTLNITELNLAEIIDELNTIIRPQTRAKQQTFKIFASSFSHELLLGDKLRINQILINILSNAVKYTPEGGEIELSVKELPQVMNDYSCIEFTVKDNGQGMSDEYQKVIFDPFTREENDFTDKIQGTGLGMAITKSLVDLMGGSIKVDSKLGKGSTFTLELELKIQEKEDDPEFWDSNGVARMIVADDEEEVCLNVMKAMQKTGVTVHYATSGKEAVRMMREAREGGEPYDLILLDWKMPDLDGLETARLIRKNYSKKIPIFFFTAYDWREIEQEAMEIGVDHFLPKPFFMHSFKMAIAKVMGGREARPTIASGESVVVGKNIMVVDDVEVNRMILTKILGSLGATCEMAQNGQEAVEMFMTSRPGTYDIILMDVQMPVMNGYDATRAIRESGHDDGSSVAIIAMTANAFVDDVRDALAAGMDAHVSKPIVLDQLKSTIQEVMARKGQ